MVNGAGETGKERKAGGGGGGGSMVLGTLHGALGVLHTTPPFTGQGIEQAVLTHRYHAFDLDSISAPLECRGPPTPILWILPSTDGVQLRTHVHGVLPCSIFPNRSRIGLCAQRETKLAWNIRMTSAAEQSLISYHHE